MSHTYQFSAVGVEDACVIINADWSGPGKVRWKPEGQDWQEVELPGAVIQGLALASVGQAVEGRVHKVLDTALDELRSILRPAAKKVDEFVNKKTI